MGKYVQYGCGLSAPEGWINFDASPTLRIQKLPIIGTLLGKKLNVRFPSSVKYGDIVKGLNSIEENSCDGIYCSHVLEHLSLTDFRMALSNTYVLLRKGGIFRCVVPDMEYIAREYIATLQENSEGACVQFMRNTLLGSEDRPKNLKDVIVGYLGNSKHLWMWDRYSLANELEASGFHSIRNCAFHDSEDEMFSRVEDESRFVHAVAIEAVK